MKGTAAKPRVAAKAKPKGGAGSARTLTRREAAVRALAREAVDLFARTPGVEGPSPAVPSSLDLDRNKPSAARSGRAELEVRFRAHPETAPEMTAGDIDADWESAYSVGDEAPGGDNPTPGQDIVENVGKALGVNYEDGEELKAADKIEGRDRHRWELDPASAEDYPERTKGGRRRKK